MSSVATASRRRVIRQDEWMAGRVATLPTQWAGDLLAGWEKKAGGEAWGGRFRAANIWLRDTTESLKAIRIPLDASDGDICALAKKRAEMVMELAKSCTGLEALRAKAGEYCRRWGVEPPEAMRKSKRGGMVGVKDGPAVARMTDHLWWRRKLRTVHARNLEAEAIRMGYVHRRGQVYASDVTVERRTQQKIRNAKALEGTEAVNLDTGEIYTLAELAAKAVSNPAIRRGELMVRLAGFEAVAKGVGHVGEFVTVTCPSRMHPKKINQRTGAVFDNPKYDGTTPRQAQKYLGKLYQSIRAAWGRRGVFPYGFRIVEPHHDGTPHWHMLLFIAKECRRKMLAVLNRYVRREDRYELNSIATKRARFMTVPIDWARGSAAGYVAKYVSKNIDGFQVQTDLEGENMDAVTGSRRVEAWATTWGIRQFQQVGGPPVGVWRELRRMEQGQESPTVEAARSAADVGNWGRYVEVQGGPVVPREALPLRTAYTRAGERYDAQAGESYPAPLTRYGEIAPGMIFGVRDVRQDLAYPSRFFRWEIRRGGNAAMANGLYTGNANSGKGGNGGSGTGVGGVDVLGFHCSATGGLDRGHVAEEVGRGGNVGDRGLVGRVAGRWAKGNSGAVPVGGFGEGVSVALSGVGVGVGACGGCGIEGGGIAAAPWSPVNNCTEGERGGTSREGRGPKNSHGFGPAGGRVDVAGGGEGVDRGTGGNAPVAGGSCGCVAGKSAAPNVAVDRGRG